MDKLLLGTFYYIYKLLSSVAEYHINCLCTELSLLLCILSSWWFYVEALAINGYQDAQHFMNVHIWSINTLISIMFMIYSYIPGRDSCLSYLQNRVWNNLYIFTMFNKFLSELF